MDDEHLRAAPAVQHPETDPTADRPRPGGPQEDGGAGAAAADGGVPAPAGQGDAEVATPTDAPVRVPADARRRRRLVGLLLGLTAVVAVVDQVTKLLAEERLEPGVVTPLLGDLLGLQLIYNPGAAFSFATGMTWIFTLISLVVLVVILRVARRLGSVGWAAALGLLLGGLLGNLYDRLFREPGFAVGHVVDFINYGGYFVGNVADIAIVGAAVLIGILALRGREVDGTLAGEVVAAGASETAGAAAAAGASETAGAPVAAGASETTGAAGTVGAGEERDA
ncbi:signal peptidase II [Georgenia sp. AZ-5]|uniref:signal peptidase II n=1 Tax=Georgenia sp. AZ-5 TaxID=3367526 RepID=UPI0037553167